jgi:branched-chain amino acid transport system ATP-binding protein
MSFFEAKEISVRFGGLSALHQVSFSVEEGEIFSIIGPNGAGKTTVFNCLSRYYDLDSGSFHFKGQDISKVAPHMVARLGIARTFQNIELFKRATVIDNLLLGCYRNRRSNFLSEAFFTRSVRRQEIQSREKAEEVMDFLNLQAYREQRIEGLPYGIQKSVELGRALTMGPELLLLDEPSAGLNEEERQDLIFWIDDIKQILGITIILIEHNMPLVDEVSDRVMALNFGKSITTGTSREIMKHPEVIKAYLGEERGLT